MKKLIILFLLFISQHCFAQVRYVNNDLSCEVYKAIIKSVDKGATFSKRFYVQQSTSTRLIKKYHFKNPSYNSLYTDSARFNKRYNQTADWKMFLNSIDTAKITNHALDCTFNNNYKFLKYNKDYECLYTFSPVIFSASGDKAICSYDYYAGPEDGWGGVFFLEKRDGEWLIVNVFRMYIS